MDNQAVSKLAAQLFFQITHTNLILESVYSAKKPKQIKPEILVEEKKYWLYRNNKSRIFL